MTTHWEYLVLRYSDHIGEFNNDEPRYTATLVTAGFETDAISYAQLSDLLTILNKMGKEGWELVDKVNVASTHQTDKLFSFAAVTECTFKRAIAA